jgi:hypothetical protein
MVEQKADRAIRQMEKELTKLAHIMPGKPKIGVQRVKQGGWT